MKRLDLVSRAFGAFIVLAMLTACGGTQMPPVAGVQSQSSMIVSPTSKLSGEVLSATNVRLHYPHNLCPILDEDIVDFVVSGNATGPYPGTFTATGQWASKPNRYRSPGFGQLNEHFTITSGSASYSGAVGYYSQEPTGSCTDFGVNGAHYRSKALDAKGAASVNISKDGFGEQFY